MSQHNGRAANEIIFFNKEQKQACCVGVFFVKIGGVALLQRDQSGFDTLLTNALSAFCKV